MRAICDWRRRVSSALLLHERSNSRAKSNPTRRRFVYKQFPQFRSPMDCAPKKLSIFQQQKQSTLTRKDLSLKGSIDEPIRSLVDVINASPHYYTTSTCSGRVTLIEKPHGRPNCKNGNRFILSSHQIDEVKNLSAAIRAQLELAANSSHTCLWLKFEPFILHVQCLDLDRAQALLAAVLSAGCRNSGLTLGKPDKFMVAVRCASSMEVPLSCGSEFQLDSKYLDFLCLESERRLTDNLERLARLECSLAALLAPGESKI